MRLASHRLLANNTSHASENKIHDDAVAKRFGFAGGLVPGVDVYAYMTHAPVAHWGRDWLAGGAIEARFVQPIYDGAETVVEASLDGAGVMRVTAESRGQTCGEATARMGEEEPPPVQPVRQVEVERWPEPPPEQARPPASPESLAVGTVLGVIRDQPVGTVQSAYLADMREDLPIYCDHGLVHPSYLLRRANTVLKRHVRLGPWIHVASRVWNRRALKIDEPFATRATVLANYARKGHLIVELGATIAAGDDDPICHIHHTAIYLPRQVRDAA